MNWHNRNVARLLLGLSLLAFLSFDLVGAYHVPAVWALALKGASVGFLAALALAEVQGRDGKLLAGYLALGAAGDVAIEFDLKAGAALFLVGHLVAATLFTYNRRPKLAPTQLALALVLLVAVPAIGWAFTHEWTTVIYALALATMAASAWTSRFSRYSVGIGAMLFVASDLLIFARLGPLAGSSVPTMLVWPLYYFGQYLICLGVLRRLRQEGQAHA